MASDRLYLDHAATTPILPQAKAAMAEALESWSNPSSPHGDGRAARAALEDARRRIGAALGWGGQILFTSGASEAIAIALTRAKAARILTSPVEHDSVLRVTPQAERLEVTSDGLATLSPVRAEPVEAQHLFSEEKGRASTSSARTDERVLLAVQHVNNETGVIQPLDAIARENIILFADCAQSAAKLPLPDADMIAVSAHKFGGPPGIGALLIKDLVLIDPSGGQEQGYRAGTENLPAILAMAAALEARADWLPRAATLRAKLDAAIEASGGEIVARDAPRIPTIAGYRMPGLSARAQLIQFDLAGISVSAGSACSSGSLKTSHVLRAMGWDDARAGEVVRVSFGPDTSEADVDRFVAAWTRMAERAR
ncbi:aminotransferase class V-fold PLP-dependent enzyme [Sphingobium indicum]|uniref:Cysteine desulfurase n=2 Tax=Sphingobium indicum TaxID=332055 RepID=A0A1L5BM13_SPHIB|nr:aminotransferase class V-fold PLP-dependent enzyme [Sphingobium indicum]APL93827.1 aminotransferase [Sphingobium indicum B90A]KEY97256.1 aminotransferase [Sphingomonas sp. BHC-A]NYI21612.1 cysteine desulfurase [Sphingobium indicum]RYM03607.1 aminotransferase class V-fold PLP-dependent enzyme [Sphingobium indicum]